MYNIKKKITIAANVQITHNSHKQQLEVSAVNTSKPKKHNIARTILNIFGSHAHSSKESTNATRGKEFWDINISSTKSGRRPSVDTVSTYLSHDTASRVNFFYK